MSATLYALIVLQGTTFSISPGYPSQSECFAVYRGPNVGCYQYDPAGTKWTAFFQLGGGVKFLQRFPNENECLLYIGALKPEIPATCRQLSAVDPCATSCSMPLAPAQPAPPTGSIPPKPDLPGRLVPADPAASKPGDIQVGGKEYTKVAGLTWIEKRSLFADVSVGPNDLESKDRPFLAERPASPPSTKTVQAKPAPRYVPPQYAQHPEPLKAIVDVVMLPWDFLAYPGRRDW